MHRNYRCVKWFAGTKPIQVSILILHTYTEPIRGWKPLQPKINLKAKREKNQKENERPRIAKAKKSFSEVESGHQQNRISSKRGFSIGGFVVQLTIWSAIQTLHPIKFIKKSFLPSPLLHKWWEGGSGLRREFFISKCSLNFKHENRATCSCQTYWAVESLCAA